MPQILRLPRSRRALVAGLFSLGVLALSLVAAWPEPAGALPANSVIWRYYSDPSTAPAYLVGISILECDGSRYIEGNLHAPYRTIESEPCHDSQPGDF